MKGLPASIVGLTLACLLASRSPAQLLPNVDPSFDTGLAAARSRIMVNPQYALVRADDLRRYAMRLQDPHARRLGAAIADWLRAESLLGLNRPIDALTTIRSGLEMVELAVPGSALEGELIMARGGASNMLGRVQDALRDYQAAFRIYQRANSPRGQSVALQNIGIIYYYAGDYRSALKYNKDSIEVYSQDPALLLSAYNNRGNMLIELGRARQATKEYGSALTAARKLTSPLLETRVLQNLARAQADSRDYTAADITLARAYAIARSGPAADWRPALDGVAALVALRRHDLDRAAMLIARTFAGAHGSGAAMPMRDFHRTAYEIFRERGDDAAALTHLEAFKKLDDEARTLAASNSAALMTARFDFANQDAKIKRLQLSQERDRAAFRATVTGGLLAAATVISTLLAFGFFSIRRSRNQVRAANDELTVTNAELGKALAAKTEFLATTSHEIRTPLNGILGMTQVILADRSVAGSLRNRIELVQGAGETMRALVDDILDVAKMETGELRIHPVEMNLARLLEDTVTVWTGQAQTKGIAVHVDLEECPAGILADEVRLRQILFNLMSNAIKFTDKGFVRLTVSTEPRADGEHLVIHVQDSGIGIPPDRLEDIFASFRQVDGGTTRRHGGTGLGLAICRNLARAMGGDVHVASTLGTGSVFTLDLPLDRIDLSVTAAADRGPVDRLSAAEMLLLDANPLAQGILRAVLTPNVRGLRVVSRVDEALETMASGGVDHVVADGASLALDPDIAGQLATAARAAGARMTLLWPAPSVEIIAILTEKGADHLLAKPISAPDLLAALQMVYGNRDASRDIAA